jgi:SNF2 family DNA or RNA helicase
MHERIPPHFLRRKKSEVLTELPPIQIQDVPLELTRPQRDAYDSVWQDREELMAAGGPQSGSANLLAIITRLKQICNLDPDTDASCKLEALKLILANLYQSNEKVLIFSQYVNTLNWLSGQLEEFPHHLFHGGMSTQQKDKSMDQFKSLPGPRGLFISLKAGGVGLNLQEASVVVLFDRWWNPATEDQALGRAHRMGQEAAVHVYRFAVLNTIEERIGEILAKKELMFAEYIDNAESAEIPAFDNTDLFKLLDLQHCQSK